MTNKNILSTLAISLLVFSFLFLALPEKSYSGVPPLPGGPPCCDLPGGTCFGGETAQDQCDGNIPGPCELGNCEFFGNSICVADPEMGNNFGSCVVRTTNVPTLSEWGLVAMAGILGILGFIMVIRRKKAAA